MKSFIGWGAALILAWAPGQEAEVHEVALGEERARILEVAERFASVRWRAEERHAFHGEDERGVRIDTPDAEFREGGWTVGEENVGMPYAWGGFTSLERFEEELAAERYAGHVPVAGRAMASDRTVGVDCSGLVSHCWSLPLKQSTRSLGALSYELADYDELEPGDIVNVDVTTRLGGLHGDTSETFFVGAPSPEARHVVGTARRCRDAGIAAIRDGAPLGAIGAAVEEVARAAGCSVVRQYGGHGIGVAMHLPPWVPHVSTGRPGPTLRAGVALTVEPMVNLGTAEVVEDPDGWTVRTADGSLSAQFEHTVLVTARGAEILTRP